MKQFDILRDVTGSRNVNAKKLTFFGVFISNTENDNFTKHMVFASRDFCTPKGDRERRNTNHPQHPDPLNAKET